MLERARELELATRFESEEVREPPKLARRPPPRAPRAPREDGGGFDSCAALIAERL